MAITMTTQEVLRSQVMAQVLEGVLDQASAAARLGLSVRQVKRLKCRMQAEGVAGLISKKHGKRSIRAFNRRFAVVPSMAGDAHVPYTGSRQALQRILSVHTNRRLSNNLSCQHEGLLDQVHSADQGLALRGAHVSVVEHSNGKKELLWQGRVLPHTCSIKSGKQSVAAVDGKAVNAKVEQALRQRQSPSKAIGHPWKQPMASPLGAVPVQAQFAHTKDSFAPTSA